MHNGFDSATPPRYHVQLVEADPFNLAGIPLGTVLVEASLHSEEEVQTFLLREQRPHMRAFINGIN